MVGWLPVLSVSPDIGPAMCSSPACLPLSRKVFWEGVHENQYC